MWKMFLLAFLFSSIGYSQIDCTKFKTGKFYYEGLSKNNISIRNDSIQESYNKGKLEMIWKIKWLNECSFELVCQTVLSDNGIKAGDRIVTEIVSTELDCFSYTFIFYSKEWPEGQSGFKGTMCFVKD